MKRAPRSIYADIYVKEAHRIKGTPRVARPWRPKVIAWAGPAAFYPNRLILERTVVYEFWFFC